LISALRSVGIVGTGSCTPPRVLTNFDLEKMVDTSDEWIRTRSGIQERRIAEADVASSDLALESALAALASAGSKAADIDLIIVGTVTPDMLFPCTASIVQQALGAKDATAFDLLVGCTGFVYGLAVAREMIATGAYEQAVVIGAETLSKTQGRGILAYSLGNDGANADALKIPAGGSRLPATSGTVAKKLHYLTMNGPEIFKFAVRTMAESSEEAVRRAGLTMQEVDVVIPHQANIRIIDAAAKRFDIPVERFVTNLDRYGNTSSASIPLALDEAVRQQRIHVGDTVALSSFGAGLAWGSMVLRW